MSLPDLRDLLARHFNQEELRQLCFDLGIEYEDLRGDTRHAKAQALVAYCHRTDDLPHLITRCRALRPAVNWPAPPPAADQAGQLALQAEAQALYDRASGWLSPQVRLPTRRDALFSEAFYPAHEWVLDQIDFAGAAAVFLPRCWRKLQELAPDGYLHVLLLRQLRQQVGGNQQQQLDDLIAAWQQHCRAGVAAQAETPPSLPPRRPTPVSPTSAPALFLSFAQSDAPLAARLRTELAAYGYACHLPPLTHRGGGDWLAATAAGLGSAYAVLLLIGADSAADRWQRIEYLGAADRQKPIIPMRLQPDAAVPTYVREAALDALTADDAGLATLLRRLPPQPPASSRAWAGQNDALRPRLAELLYMDRLKLAELQHVAQYTRLSGEAEIRRHASGRVRLQPVVARTEFVHAPWREDSEQIVRRFTFTDAVAQLQTIRRAVLLGDPGSGKTTTLYRLAADLIEAAWLDRAAPVPLMVRLGLWTEGAEPFSDFLRRGAVELGDHLGTLLVQGRVALLLDGLNEIPSDQQAGKYRQVRDFLAGHAHLLAWVSCREQDYPPDRDLGLDRVTVAPLDAVRVREFVGNYLDALPDYGPTASADLFWQLAGAAAHETYTRFTQDVRHTLPDEAERFAAFWLAAQLPPGVTWGYGSLEGYENKYWEDWLQQRAHPASLLLLATNPYMLFMLLDVYQAYRRLPDNRGQLFDQFVQTLLVRERLLARDKNSGAVIFLLEGTALLAALTGLAFALQTQRTGQKGAAAALTALPLAEATAYLTEQHRYQAASANLLLIGADVRFAHQLLQEYFAARGMRERIWGAAAPASPPVAGAQSLRAVDIWPPREWWQPTNWEEATILLAGLYSDDCTRVLEWVAEANPEVAARCVVESGAHTPEETKRRLRDRWLPRLADAQRDPDARARAAVGRALGRITLRDGAPLDNRPGVGIVVRNGLKLPHIVWGGEVPTGTYTIGGDKDAYGGEARKKVRIEHPYRLARYPVTYAQFQCFVAAADFNDARWWAGMPAAEEAYGTVYPLRELSEQTFPFDNHPRESVSWYQAIAFCRWLSHHLGEEIDLPHEYEWEVAARYPDGRFYPWGNTFDPAKANTWEGARLEQTSAVGLYPDGTNPTLGLYDLSGNVWEWCRNKYKDPVDAAVDVSGAPRTLRGGSWPDGRDFARAACRNSYHPDRRYSYVGLRVVVVRRPCARNGLLSQ